VNSLLAGNIWVGGTVVHGVNWIVALVAGWLVVSVIVAVVAGRMIRTRDEHEIPAAWNEDGTDEADEDHATHSRRWSVADGSGQGRGRR
jgi:hypothetical protein